MHFSITQNCFRNLFAAIALILAMSNSLFAGPSVPPLPLVASEWLKDNLYKNSLVIIDTRSKKEYLQNHIVGAINLPVAASFKMDNLRNKVISLSEIKALLSNAGIKNNHSIIIYDSGIFKDSARFFWLLSIYGHQHVSILNGGFHAWHQAKMPVTSVPRNLARSDYIPLIGHRFITTKLGIRLALKSPNTFIIDARSVKNFNAVTTKSKKSGRIPQAINVPWYSSLNEEQPNWKLKSIAELRSIFQKFDKDKYYMIYCERGKESAVIFYTMHLLGYKVAVYDGAWIEWSRDKSLPIERASRAISGE